MLKEAILVLAIITNEGDIEMDAKKMDQCPDKAVFSKVMDDMKADGKFIDWNALCLHPEGAAKGQETSNE